MDKAMHSEFEGHTPGPWETRKPRTPQDLVSHYVQSESANLAICRVLKDQYRTNEEAEVNAKLIAAAPDLLKENQSLRSELQKLKKFNAELFKYEVSPRVAGLIIQVRDAIATKDYDEAYHILYQIASPGFNKTDPWGELESLIKKYKES